MSEKRRDNKNRILRTGESQRSDGKYMYRYVDFNLKTQCIYSWRLVGTDPVPAGKKDNGALRDKEKLIQKDLDDNILPEGAGLTVLNLTKKLRKNPFEFVLATVLVNDAVTREAITRKEERTFLDFIKNDKHYCRYYDGMYILFKTGMRISEFTGLTVKDIDMEKRTINIDHQLQKTGTLIYIDTTKTYSGKRIILMSEDVYECFERILENKNPPKVEPMIDG